MSEQRTAPPAGGAPEKPSRYDRSFGGLVAAMICVVLLVGAYVGVRALLRQQPDVTGDKVNYLSQVRDLQQAGTESVIYPPTLPPGWRATSVDYSPGTIPTWGIGFVTDDDHFVGIRQQKTAVDDLLHTYVDDNPQHGSEVTVPSAVGDSWDTWSDSGGDHAFVIHDASTGETTMVFGSASVETQEAFIQTLTTDPLPSTRSSSSSSSPSQ